MTTSATMHIAIGSIALALYWAALLASKGSTLHKSAGRICLSLLVLVALSVGPILVNRPGSFDPGYVVQMVYLTISLGTVSFVAWSSIRFKSSPERFRGRLFRTLGPVLLFLGLVTLTAGVINRDPFALVMSWVGLVYGAAMIGFSRFTGQLHPRWWLGWHLNAVAGLFNAVNGNFLYVASVWSGLFSAGPAVSTSFQIATTATAIVIRIWFGQKFKAPIGFGIRLTRGSITEPSKP